jgi:hypothetical protein
MPRAKVLREALSAVTPRTARDGGWVGDRTNQEH